jgi:hypothetical protein
MYFNFIGNIEFASRWKKALSPDSVARGKATGQLLAQNKSDVSKGIYTQAQTQKDLAYGVEKGKKLAATGRQAMLTKAASPNRTMRPTKQRGNLKVARSPGSNISPKSAQTFKQGAQNQAINVENARKNKVAQQLKQNVEAKVKTNPTPSSTPFTPPRPKVKIPPTSAANPMSGMADNIAKGVGRNMLKKKALIGVGLAAAGGLYAARKAKKERQQRPFKRLFS